MEESLPQTYYITSFDFLTEITQVTSTGNRFAETIDTAVLEAEEKVRSKFVSTEVLLEGNHVIGEGLLALPFLRGARAARSGCPSSAPPCSLHPSRPVSAASPETKPFWFPHFGSDLSCF